MSLDIDTISQHEFLPLCDVLFNIISLAAYFCNIVFDIVLVYALYTRGQTAWFSLSIFFILLSLVIEQIVSLRWYLHLIDTPKENKQKIILDTQSKFNMKKIATSCIILLHVMLLGILWRYFKLFIPVDLQYVKYEVRDLCVLRLLHAFCASTPMLLIQSYLLWQVDGSSKEFTVSTVISLFNVCWALASFSKNVRMQNVHRLVLTWLGVICQFVWRLGTVGARILSLTAYATVYSQWVFLVLGSHWLCMLLWLTSPKNVFHGEHISKSRKAAYYSLIAFIYTFAYINLLEINHREKMAMFYFIMGLENGLLMFVWSVGVSQKPPWYYVSLPLAVFLLFFSGLGFMFLYYQYFHVRRLKYETGGRMTNNDSNTSTARLNPDDRSKYMLPNGVNKDLSQYSSYLNNGTTNENGYVRGPTNRYPSSASHGGIPGVFNCRFTNPYMAAIQKRKKKKPTSFIPPPSVTSTNSQNNCDDSDSNSNPLQPHMNVIPFWCRPLPNSNQQGGSSETESNSQGYRVNIQQKLQEKKQKQLAELKVIEEEIKQGKHQRPGSTPAPLEPPPPPPPRGKQPPQSNSCEILLTPYYLENEGGYYDWNPSAVSDTAPMYRLSEKDGDEERDQMLVLMYKSYRMTSDLDSQVSLPRSYTLPREFKYYRRPKQRKALKTEHFIASTNSSDGDVDSGDENDSDGSSHNASQLGTNMRLTQPMFRKHETKL